MQPTETPRIDEYGRLLCHATTREGEPCKSPCVTGMKVCRMHGGSSPQARNRAKLRLAELVDPAIGTLARVMTNQDGNATPSDRLRAANSILDRAGHGRMTKVEAVDARELLTHRLLELQAARDQEEEGTTSGEEE